MKMYLVEFESVTTPEKPIEIFVANDEESAWHQAYTKSYDCDYLCTGEFDMYLLLRNPNGELYLADLDGDGISSAGTFYGRLY